MTIKVAIVEDDADYRSILGRALTDCGLQVELFPDAETLEARMAAVAPDIVLLDVNLPGVNGFTVAARLRVISTVGIIMLTGRSPREDRLTALTIGADHYFVKPVDICELEVVIRNLARRLKSGNDGTIVRSEVAPVRTDPDAWIYYPEKWVIESPKGDKFQLSMAENQLLRPLLEHPGVPEDRDSLNARLGKPRQGHESRSLDVLVSRLRRRIEKATEIQFPLKAARSAGYVFVGSVVIAS